MEPIQDFAQQVVFLNGFERAAIVAARAQQIACGFKSFLTQNEIKKLNFQPLAIAEEEVIQRKLSFVIERKTPQGAKCLFDCASFRE